MKYRFGSLKMQNLDNIQALWAREMPQLDTSTMALIGRLQIAHKHMTLAMSKTFRRYGLSEAGFDVLATLRRSGPPYRLTPNQLLMQMLVTSGSMTSRLNQLKKQQLITRSQDQQDKRICWVQLTEQGLALSKEVIQAHVETQQTLLAGLSREQHQQLLSGLQAYLQQVGLE